MRHLTIEWRHLDEKGETCLRCSQTGKTLHQLIAELKKELKPKNIKVTFKEKKLAKTQIDQSNMILINDMPLEQLLSEANISKNYCKSCTCLTGDNTFCRTLQYNGRTYEEIPEEIIRRAVLKAVELDRKGEKK